MAVTTQRIPLFPLGVVLFPASRVPLHIFEDRYKKLCEISMKNHSAFGINYVEEDKLHSFTIAHKSGLEADQRQALLAITSENERLSILKNFLSQLLPKVKEIETINDLIRNDGYIVTWNKKK